jgi:hypothetical protein
MRLLIQSLFISFLALSPPCIAQVQLEHNGYLQRQKDFKSELKYFDVERKEFLPINNIEKDAVYLALSLKDFQNRYLSIKSKKGTSLFINNIYASTFETDSKLLSIDSLLLQWPEGEIQLAIYHPEINIDKLEVGMMKRVSMRQEDANTRLILRENNFEKDFLIIALMIVLIAFALLISTNPKLTSEYLNIRRVLTIREREENILNARLSSPINLVYYGFCAMVTSLFFIIVINASPINFELSSYTQSPSLVVAMLKWMVFSIVIFVLIVARAFVLFILANTFDMRPFLSLHHFNFIRLSLIVFGFGLMLSAGFLLSGLNSTHFYSGLLMLLNWVFGFWIIILLLKLIGRAEFRISHLFSYICGSEVIPFLVIIKVLYF